MPRFVRDQARERGQEIDRRTRLAERIRTAAELVDRSVVFARAPPPLPRRAAAQRSVGARRVEALELGPRIAADLCPRDVLERSADLLARMIGNRAHSPCGAGSLIVGGRSSSGTCGPGGSLTVG